jgi:arginine decarboxylase
MSAIRQRSMLAVKDVDFHTVEQQFKEAVFTHASTSPNQQLIASLDVSRRQMELEGYGLVANAMEIALAIRKAVNNNPLISKYFHILGADAMVPQQYRQSGFVDYLAPVMNWATILKSLDDDEFCLDPTRMTLVCGTAGFDGTQFKGILANEYSIQVNKTSRNSVLIQSNINNTRSDIAHLVRVLPRPIQTARPTTKNSSRYGLFARYSKKPFISCSPYDFEAAAAWTLPRPKGARSRHRSWRAPPASRA